jgi:hypothetical protein
VILLALGAFFPPRAQSGALWESSAKRVGINIAGGQFHEQKGHQLGAFDEAVFEEEFGGAVDLVAADA